MAPDLLSRVGLRLQCASSAAGAQPVPVIPGSTRHPSPAAQRRGSPNELRRSGAWSPKIKQMSHRLAAAVVLLLAAATGVQAQVYRCADRPVYTDKPCRGAAPVDVRPNLLDAGPRGFPVVPLPQNQLTIIPDARPQQPVGTGGGSAFGDRDAREAQFRARTGPF
jgi:hypothetical protein